MNLGVRWKEPRIFRAEPRVKETVDIVYKDERTKRQAENASSRANEDDEYYYVYEYEEEVPNIVPLDTKFVRHLWVPDVYVHNMKYGSRMLTDFDGEGFF